ncbi:MAG: hypothetical protein WCO89_04135 [Syntrophus sp. (in: bacteria)]
MEQMEHTEDLSQSPSVTEAAIQKPASPSHLTGIIYLALCLVVSIAAAVASSWWFTKTQTHAVDVYVVDVKAIVDAKKKELIENYKKSPTDETIVAADKDLIQFLVKLDQGITRLGNGGNRLVILKDIYLGGDATDATEALANTLKMGAQPSDKP